MITKENLEKLLTISQKDRVMSNENRQRAVITIDEKKVEITIPGCDERAVIDVGKPFRRPLLAFIDSLIDGISVKHFLM